MNNYSYEPNPSIDYEPEWEPDESWFYDDDHENEPDFDCGWTGEGCQLAGSEDCDFECPYHDYYYGIDKSTSSIEL